MGEEKKNDDKKQRRYSQKEEKEAEIPFKSLIKQALEQEIEQEMDPKSTIHALSMIFTDSNENGDKKGKKDKVSKKKQ